MAKNNKNLYIGIGVAVAVAAIVGVIVVLATRGGGDNGGEPTPNSVLTAGDFTPIEQSIEFGDYDAMFTLSKAIQNGEATGKIVEIDGTVSKVGSSYSIMQRNAEDTESIGTKFTIEGDDVTYPADGTRVVMVAKVVERKGFYWDLQTIPELVSVYAE